MRVKNGLRTVCSILLLAAMVLSLGLPGRTEPTASAEGADGALCRLTIDNGAASANTDSAVNGLHVYDPNSAELEDFVSGAELPLGSTVTVYVYNLASPVALTIIHNGQTVVEERFETMRAFEDDDKVKFFEFTLEGDLEVRTAVLEEETEEREARPYPVHIENAALASVSWNGRVLKDGDTVLSGEQDFTVQTGAQEAALTLTMAVSEHTVTLVDAAKADGASLLVTHKGRELASGERLEDGAELTASLHNDAQQTVKLLALLGDELRELAALEPGEAWEDSLKVEDDLVLLVSAVNRDNDTVTVTLPETPITGLRVSAADGAETLTDGATLPVGTEVTVRLAELTERAKLTVIHNGELLLNETLAPSEQERKTLTLSGDLIVLASEASEETVILNEAKLDANSSYSISRVEVKGELFFRFHEREKKDYPVTVENHTNQTLTVGYVDDSSGTPVAVQVASGQSVPGGTYLGARAINTLTDRKLILSAYVGGALVGSVTVDARSGELDGANGLYVTLNGAARFVLDYGEAVTPKQEEETSGECTVTVKNNAASANTDYAVNGLHVYKAPAEDDITDSASFAKGEEIELYVYNCASPVHLTVVHNGKTVVDKDYPQREAWVDDDKIEYLSFTLEGDLTVTTTALESYEQPAQSYTVHLTGDQAASAEIYIDNDYAADGGSISAGEHDILVMGEGVVTVSVGGVQVDAPQDASYAEFYSVNVTGDLTIDVSAQSAETTYTVTLVDTLGLESVKTNLSWVDYSGDMPASVPIRSGDSVKENTGIYVQVVNDSDKAVRVSARIGNELLGEAEIEAGEAGGLMGENYGGLTLTGNMTVTVEEKPDESELCTITINDGAKAANTDSAVNGLHVYCTDRTINPGLDDYQSGAKAAKGTPVSIYVYNYASPVQLTVVHNGETVASKVYPMIDGYAEIESIDLTLAGDLVVTSSVPEAAQEAPKLHILGEKAGFVYPLNGYNDYADGAALEKDRSYDFTVYGNEDVDVRVTVKVGESEVASAEIAAGYNTHDFTGIQATDDISFLFEELTEEPTETGYTVTVVNPLAGDGVTVNLSWLDWSEGSPNSVSISSGDSVKAGTGIFVQVQNASAKPVTVTASIGGTAIGSADVAADDFGGLMGEEYSGLALTGNMTITVAEKSESAQPCTVTVTNGAASANTNDAVNALHVYEAPSGDDFTGSVQFARGTTIELYVYNYASPVHLTVVHNGQTVTDKVYAPIIPFVDDDKIEYLSFTLEGDLSITTEAASSQENPPQSYTVHLTGDQAASAEIYIDSDYAADGGSIPAGSHDIMVMGEGQVTVSVGGVQVDEPQDASYAEFYGVNVNGDLTIDVSSVK